ncbi:MAG: hypothetical protein AAF687_05080 [Pseudomonadota bacterium]
MEILGVTDCLRRRMRRGNSGSARFIGILYGGGMHHAILTAAAALTALQSAPTEPAPQSGASPVDNAITELSQLPISEATPPRCGVVFAIIDRAQKEGDENAKQWPDLADGSGREFFVRAMAKLMDDRKFTQEQISALTMREVELMTMSQASEMMPACLLMKRSAGL